MTKTISIISTLLISVLALGQQDSVPEIHVSEAIIESIYSAEVQYEDVDEQLLQSSAHTSLGELLSKSGQLQVLNYGAPGSTISARKGGLSADHTAVNWNGIPLNSLTLGTTDLSLFPAFFFDDIKLYEMGNSLGFATSSFGGAINMRTSESDEDKIDVFTSVSSLENYSSGLSLSLGSERIKYSGKYYTSSMSNKFEFVDIYKFDEPTIEQLHNAAKHQSTIHDLTFYLPKSNILRAGVWWNERQKEIPEIMGSFTQSFAEQHDQSLRGYIEWEGFADHLSFSALATYGRDLMHYTDRQKEGGNYIIDSRISTNSAMLEGNVNYFKWKNQSVFLRGRFFDHKATTANYLDGQASERREVVNLNYVYSSKKYSLQAALSEEFVNEDSNPLAYSLALAKRWSTRNSRWNVHASGARKYRIPDFNEKYWVPGGNAELKPESGVQYRMGVGGEKNWSNFTIDGDVSYQQAVINDWIEWVNTGSFFSPVNLKKVDSKITTAKLNLKWSSEDLVFSIGGRYNYVMAQSIADETKSLAYAPKHSLSGSGSVAYKSWLFLVRTNYSGEYYSDLDNTSWLVMPDYSLIGVHLKKEFSLEQSSLAIEAYVDNLLNKSYQVVRSYATPGRVVGLSLRFNYSIKKK